VFAALPAKELEALAAAARDESHRTREYVFMEGDPSHWLYIVTSGRVKILKHSRTGKDVVLELLGPGEVFGGVAVIEKRPYPATAQTTEPSVILKLPADGVIALADRHPSVIREMALMIGRRLRAAQDSVKSLAVDPVEAPLAAALVRLAERDGGKSREGLILPIHLTRQSLADMTGTTDHEPLAPERSHRGRRPSPGPEGSGCAPRPGRGGSGVTLGEPGAPLIRRHIKTSFVFLVAGLLLGGYILIAGFVLGRYPPRLFITAHVHLLLVGFMLNRVSGSLCRSLGAV
jgi:CRP-like cAMP-binding protein